MGCGPGGRPQVQRPAGRLPERATVGPDDSVVFTDKEWALLWLLENGL